MAAFEVNGRVMIEGCVHTSCSQSIRNGPEAELPEGTACGKSQKSRRRGRHTGSRHPSRTEPAGEPAALEAGYDGPEADDHGDHSGTGDRDPKLPIHRGPGSAQKRVGKAQAYEGQIDHCQKYMCHGPAPRSLRNIRPGSRPLIPVRRKTPAHGRSGAQLPYIPLKRALIPLWRPRPDGWWARPEEGCWSPG